MNNPTKLSMSIADIIRGKRIFTACVYSIIIGGMLINYGHAAEYNSWIDTSVTALQSGDTVNISGVTASPEAVYVRSGSPIDVGDNGIFNVRFESALANIRGINIANGLNNNFGTNTSVHINSTANTGSAAIGINIGSGSAVKANALDVKVTSATSSIGLDFYGTGSNLSLGSGSNITAIARSGASGIYSNKNDNSIDADHLTIKAQADSANGISMAGDNIFLNLGSGSSILAEGNRGNGIGLAGSNNGNVQFKADSLNIAGKGEKVNGFYVDKVSADSVIDLGVNSHITTDGESGTGIIFGAGALATLVADGLTVQTEGKTASAIEARNGHVQLENATLTSRAGSGVVADNNGDSAGQAPLIELNNSAIHSGLTAAVARGENAEISIRASTVISDESYGLLSEDGGSINAEHVNVTSLSGLRTQSGGKINFSVENYFSGLNGTALSSTGSESLINGTGKTSIQGNIFADDQGKVNLDLDSGSTINGTAVSKDGGYISIQLAENSVWTTPKDSVINYLSLDHSTLVISPSLAANTVTVQGDYRGTDGNILFDTVLADDSSATDKLIIAGNTSGNTLVTVHNAGGSGAHTLNGIELIHVGGISEGVFSQNGRIVAGAYDYHLVRGNGENSGNWYLVNNKETPTPTPTPAPTPAPQVKPDMRPEGASYTANLAAANSLFITTLHDRLGETQYIDALTGEKKVTSLWLRQVGNHNRWHDSTGQLATQSNGYVAQLGGDLVQWSGNGARRAHLGLMAGYGNSQSHTRSGKTYYHSRGTLDGYSLGVYGTWFNNDADKAGLYVDSWIQYSWFNNHVSGEQQATESYKSRGLTASLETGFTFRAGSFKGSKGSQNDWFVQPQAQAVWMGIKAEDHTERNGTRVTGDGEGNIMTRLGVRTYLKGHAKMDEGKARTFEPFVEANWIHNTRQFGAVMDGAPVRQSGNRDLGELKTGVEAKLNKHLHAWGNVGVQVGDAGYSNTSATIGLKYSF